MSSPHFARFAFVVAMCAMLLPRAICAQKAKDNSSSGAKTDLVYARNSKGLKKLLQNMLVEARNADQGALADSIKETEVPNYQRWFISTLGPESGEILAENYGSALEGREKDFQKLVVQLAGQNGNIQVFDFSEGLKRSGSWLVHVEGNEKGTPTEQSGATRSSLTCFSRARKGRAWHQTPRRRLGDARTSPTSLISTERVPR